MLQRQVFSIRRNRRINDRKIEFLLSDTFSTHSVDHEERRNDGVLFGIKNQQIAARAHDRLGVDALKFGQDFQRLDIPPTNFTRPGANECFFVVHKCGPAYRNMVAIIVRVRRPRMNRFRAAGVDFPKRERGQFTPGITFGNKTESIVADTFHIQLARRFFKAILICPECFAAVQIEQFQNAAGRFRCFINRQSPLLERCCEQFLNFRFPGCICLFIRPQVGN